VVKIYGDIIETGLRRSKMWRRFLWSVGFSPPYIST
jgi:hypothetical protein